MKRKQRPKGGASPQFIKLVLETRRKMIFLSKLERTRSSAQRPLQGLRFISKTIGATEHWRKVEERFTLLGKDGVLDKEDFGELIGMEDSKEFAVDIFYALARKEATDSSKDYQGRALILLNALANKLSKPGIGCFDNIRVDPENLGQASGTLQQNDVLQCILVLTPPSWSCPPFALHPWILRVLNPQVTWMYISVPLLLYRAEPILGTCRWQIRTLFSKNTKGTHSQTRVLTFEQWEIGPGR
ncbi:hypothetical protein L6164_027509 [Bauhinia variegata]|uniref:Uncharacterized protein n=1 Tax=Bauhinia variegata TaxID=167791 RepID=A0ACB9LTK4_BAUVA|nr:hypothetical protein L6164_027509 [Bauhinia variegata]